MYRLTENIYTLDDKGVLRLTERVPVSGPVRQIDGRWFHFFAEDAIYCDDITDDLAGDHPKFTLTQPEQPLQAKTVEYCPQHRSQSMLYYIKQLVPCLYRTVYHEEHNGKWRPIYHTWRMWLGRVFDEEKMVIAEALTPDLRKSLKYLEKGPPPGI